MAWRELTGPWWWIFAAAHRPFLKWIDNKHCQQICCNLYPCTKSVLVPSHCSVCEIFLHKNFNGIHLPGTQNVPVAFGNSTMYHTIKKGTYIINLNIKLICQLFTFLGAIMDVTLYLTNLHSQIRSGWIAAWKPFSHKKTWLGLV